MRIKTKPLQGVAGQIKRGGTRTMKKQEIINYLENSLNDVEEMEKQGKPLQEILNWLKHDVKMFVEYNLK